MAEGRIFELLKLREDAWRFERYDSKRSSIFNHRYFVVDRTWVKLNEFEIIRYIFTGIVKGRWIREATNLFKDNNIEMDFSVRGFINEMPTKPL